MIAAARGALVERIRHGVDGCLVSGTPGEAAFDCKFIEHVIQVLTDDDYRRKLAHNASEAVQGLDFESLARDWEDEFRLRLAALR